MNYESKIFESIFKKNSADQGGALYIQILNIGYLMDDSLNIISN